MGAGVTGDFARWAIPALWLGWLAVWIAAARHIKPTRWKETPASRLSYGVPTLLAAVLLAWPGAVPVLRSRLVEPGPVPPIAGTALVAAGVALMLWARWHLGRNWSAIAVVKEGHTLVRTGPYRHVRHPIYTGLLLAFAGTTLAIGEWRGIVAFGLMAAAFIRKLGIEERRMAETFAEYDDYRRRSWALLPLVF